MRCVGMRPLLVATALLLSVPASGQAADCPPRKGTLAKAPLGRVWHAQGSLFGCTVVYGRRPQAVRLGPWSSGGKVAFDGVMVTWTRPLRRDGVRSDRLWAASVESGIRWLTGKRLRPGVGADGQDSEARIQRLALGWQSVGWTTKEGDVGMAVREPQTHPEPLGTLPAPPQPSGARLLVGSFPDADPVALGRSLRLEVINGEGDECGGTDGYRLTVQPAAERVGVRWFGAWNRVDC